MSSPFKVVTINNQCALLKNLWFYVRHGILTYKPVLRINPNAPVIDPEIRARQKDTFLFWGHRHALVMEWTDIDKWDQKKISSAMQTVAAINDSSFFTKNPLSMPSDQRLTLKAIHRFRFVRHYHRIVKRLWRLWGKFDSYEGANMARAHIKGVQAVAVMLSCHSYWLLTESNWGYPDLTEPTRSLQVYQNARATLNQSFIDLTNARIDASSLFN